MLQLHILKHLMHMEGESSQRSGRLTGFSVAWMQKHFDIPKSTFYRHLNQMIECGFVVRQKRGYYTVSKKFRIMCNDMKQADLIR